MLLRLLYSLYETGLLLVLVVFATSFVLSAIVMIGVGLLLFPIPSARG